MKTLVFLIAILSFSCENKSGFDIPDVSKPYEQTIRSREKNPSNIRIFIKGNINGDFTLNGFTFDGGRIDTTFLLDQYSDTLSIKYSPINVTGGVLRIDYLF